ncbi:MAG: helix-turn-helix domain-containing protein [Armatimonadia bacterium]
MRQGRVANQITLTDPERAALEDLALNHPGHSLQARRARIILLSAQGRTAAEICRMLGCAGQTVNSWRRRFLKSGVTGLQNATTTRQPPRI